LVRDITTTSQGKVMWLTGNDPVVRKTLDNISLQSLKNLFRDKKFWFFDNLCGTALPAPRDGSVAKARWPDLVKNMPCGGAKQAETGHIFN
jgi:hypothetical protein